MFFTSYLGVLIAVLTWLDLSFAVPADVPTDSNTESKPLKKDGNYQSGLEANRKVDGTWCKSDSDGKIKGCYSKKGNSRSYVWTTDDSDDNGVAMSTGGSFSLGDRSLNRYSLNNAHRDVQYGIPLGQRSWGPGPWNSRNMMGPRNIYNPANYWPNYGAGPWGYNRGIAPLPGQPWPYGGNDVGFHNY